jgi:hypothetical protein
MTRNASTSTTDASVAAPLAVLHAVRKTYGAQRALDGVDLRLARGQLLALLGPNGAGKSTAIALLLGLIRADAGTVELFGADPQTLAPRRRIGVMLQNGALPDTLRVGELLRMTANYSRGRARWPSARIWPVSAMCCSAPTANCPAASSAACSSRWPCADAPNCCFSMSPRWAWTLPRASACGRRCAPCSARAARSC